MPTPLLSKPDLSSLERVPAVLRPTGSSSFAHAWVLGVRGVWRCKACGRMSRLEDPSEAVVANCPAEEVLANPALGHCTQSVVHAGLQYFVLRPLRLPCQLEGAKPAQAL